MLDRLGSVLALSITIVLLAGCGSYYRSGPGGRGVMRVQHCAERAAAAAPSHDQGRLVHRGPPPLAGRTLPVREVGVESGFHRDAGERVRLTGDVEDWMPTFADASMLPASLDRAGPSEPGDVLVVTP